MNAAVISPFDMDTASVSTDMSHLLSDLITTYPQLFEDIKNIYPKHPYHNYEHGMDVMRAGANLWVTDPIMLLCLLTHDIVHHGEATHGNEEKASAQILIELLKKYDYPLSEIDEKNIIKYMCATISSGRADISREGTEAEKIMADADLWSLGTNYRDYIANAARLLLEKYSVQMKRYPSDSEILTFFRKEQLDFFYSLSTQGEDVPSTKEVYVERILDIRHPEHHNTIKKYPQYLTSTAQEKWGFMAIWNLLYAVTLVGDKELIETVRAEQKKLPKISIITKMSNAVRKRLQDLLV